MADDSLQEQLVAQLAEHTDALEGLAALLAVDQNPELVQVFRTKRMSHLSFCSMLLRSPSSRKDAMGIIAFETHNTPFAVAQRASGWLARNTAGSC